MNILKTLLFSVLLLATQALVGQAPSVPLIVRVVGNTPTLLCLGDGLPDIIRFSTSPLAMTTAYIVVDENDIIVYRNISNVINFEQIPEGNLRVFSVGFVGAFQAQVGDNYLETELASYYFQVSANFIPVANLTPQGGTVSTAAGETSLVVCVDEGGNHVVQFVSSSDFQPYLYVITDEQNAIIGTSEDGTIDFANSPTGICRVWGLGYLGDYTGVLGDDVQTATLSSACFDLSSNYVEVTRLTPGAGALAFAVGGTEFVSCTPLAPSGTVGLVSTGTLPGTAFTYVLVETATNQVVDLFTNPNTIDLATLPTGTYQIYGLAYTGNLTFGVGDVLDTDNASDECADFSNAVTLVKRVQNADDVRLADGSSETFICVGDNQPDVLTFTSTYAGNDNFVYVITDPSNFVLGTSTDGVIDFETMGVEFTRVWGLAYSGSLTLNIGDNLGGGQPLSSECFDLSDGFVLVTRNEAVGGTLAYADGTTSYFSCTPMPVGDEGVPVATGNSPNFQYSFIMVDAATGIVTQIFEQGAPDVTFLPNGTYHIYGISYFDAVGSLTVAVGDTFNPDTVAQGCFGLSANFLELVKQSAHADDVLLENGDSEATVCVGNGLPEPLQFVTTYAGGDDFVFILTNTGNFVVATAANGIFDMEAFPAGIYRVWGLAYTGNLVFGMGDNLAGNFPLAEGCYDLSDGFATVNSNGANGGTISLADGSVSYVECQSFNNPATLTLTVADAAASLSYAYLVVNAETDLIAAILTQPTLNLGGLPLGTYLVYGVSYQDTFTVGLGDVFTGAVLADVCYDLSDNSISVINRSVRVNNITFEDGTTTTTVCPDVPLTNILSFDTDFAGFDNLAYIITDTDNTILNILAANTFNFSVHNQLGAVRVWAAAFSGTFALQTGETLAETSIISDDCYDLTNNFLLVNLLGPDGGNVATTAGATEVGVCLGDAGADILTVQATTAGVGNYAYIVTDEDNNILEISESATIDFSNATAGVCRVWGLSYLGELTALVGENAATTSLASLCADLSDNFITVTRTAVDGGTVSLMDGTTTLTFACGGDGEADLFQFAHATTAADASYAYLVTNAQNIIMAVLETNSIDLEQVASGEYRVWGLSYTGNLTAATGQNAAEANLSDDCFDLSSNFVSIQRDQVAAGQITLADGRTTINICPNDGNPDELSFVNTGNTTGAYTYVITNTDNVILSAFSSGMLDFDNIIAPAEVRVWGVAFTGLVNPLTGDINAIDISNRCFDVTNNYVTIIRDAANGGSVATTDGATQLALCTSDGLEDIYAFAATGASNTDYVFVITDENNIILDLLTNTNEFNFEGAADGISRVWGLAYTGTLIAQVGEDAAAVPLSDDCFSLSSNFVTITRGTLDAGTIGSVIGAADRYTCPGDGQPDVITFNVQGDGVGSLAYLVTDEANLVVDVLGGATFDFEALAEGTYRVWGLRYTGDLQAAAGDDAAVATLASGCFDLTDNFIQVFNYQPAGGVLQATFGSDVVSICIGDGIPDVFNVSVAGASNAAYTFLVVDLDSTLVGILEGPDFDFDRAAPGDWYIYGLSYSGSIGILPGANIFEEELGTGCFALSENFIYVDKNQVDGGNVFTDDGRTTVYTCRDGQPDIVNFINSGNAADATYNYVLTTPTNVVLSVLTGNNIDFESAAGLAGLRIWGISYTGTRTLNIGNVITNVAISNGCYTLSNNFIAVFNGLPDGGTLSFDGGADSTRFCHSNFMPGVQVNTTSTSNLGYAYLVTDTANVVLQVTEPADDVVNFDNLLPGTYRIWAVSYAGILQVVPGDDAAAVALASSCFELSDNFLTIERTESLDAGRVSTLAGEATVYACVQNETPDIVIFDNDSAEPNYRYVITDNENRIIFGDIESDILDLNASPAGIYRLYGVAYTGAFTPAFLVDITTATLSTDCWALSDNFILFVLQTPEGGTVATEAGLTEITVNVNDGTPDVVNFANTGIAFTPYVYVITDEANVILGVSADGQIDFETAGAGICRVWGLSYTGNITAQPGDDADDVQLTDDCYDLSDNFVTVNRIGNFAPNAPVIQGFQSEVVSLSVYPNPVASELNLSLYVPEALATNTQQVAIYNMSGHLLLQRDLLPNTGTAQQSLDVSPLPNGMYLLQWMDGERIIVTRFMKL